ncbi:MAG: hypothetical protein GY801_46275 [bacterium]|nr:hypothetical protein [bacterium]
MDSTLMVSYEHMVMVDEFINQLRCITGGIATGASTSEISGIREDQIRWLKYQPHQIAVAHFLLFSSTCLSKIFENWCAWTTTSVG